MREGNPVENSLDITLFIAKRYPDLIPERHHEQTTALPDELHSLNYFSLSFAEFGSPRVEAGLADTLPEYAQGSGNGPCLFDRQEQTALDAHTVVLRLLSGCVMS